MIFWQQKKTSGNQIDEKQSETRIAVGLEFQRSAQEQNFDKQRKLLKNDKKLGDAEEWLWKKESWRSPKYKMNQRKNKTNKN